MRIDADPRPVNLSRPLAIVLDGLAFYWHRPEGRAVDLCWEEIVEASGGLPPGLVEWAIAELERRGYAESATEFDPEPDGEWTTWTITRAGERALKAAA